MYALSVEIVTLTLKVTLILKACKNANISETGLDTNIIAIIIHRQEFVYALLPRSIKLYFLVGYRFLIRKLNFGVNQCTSGHGI